MAIEVIDLVMHTHTDFGYTDYPLSARQFLKEYVNEAIDYAEKYKDYPEEAKFRWTLEVLLPTWEWWQEANETDRQRLLDAIDRGQIEVCGIPFNITAFLNAKQWDYLMQWIPRSEWERMNVRGAMQIDINGLHTGGLNKVYDAGIRNIWIGANTYNGAPPIPTPALAKWDLEDGREMRIWINASYCDAFFLFYENWRQGPVPNRCDLRYRKAGPWDFFQPDEENVRKAHAACVKSIAAIEGTPDANANPTRDGFTLNKVFGGYSGKVLAASLTNQWRIDNDPPCWWICDFIKKWNELGLKPKLQLRTMSQALEDVEQGMTQPPVVLKGQWTDWWANGTASSPCELAYTRQAKRLLDVAHAPLFGPWTQENQTCENDCLWNLSMYDEHSFGAWQSVAFPDSFENRSQRAEKNIFAYRGLNQARELYHTRASCLDDGTLRNAIRVANPTTMDRTFEINLPRNCLRGDYTYLENVQTGQVIPLRYAEGIANFMRPKSPDDFGEENISRTFSDSAPEQSALFCTEIPGMQSVDFLLRSGPAPMQAEAAADYQIKTDELGWPIQVVVNGNCLVNGTMGYFHALQAEGFSPRWTFRDIFETDDAAKRDEMYRNNLHLTDGQYEITQKEHSGHLIRYTQKFIHPSLAFGKRIMTVDTANGTATVTVRFYRNANPTPEIYYIALEAPVQGGDVHISNAGKAFRPGLDQIPGSCKDYYAIDGWVHHQNGQDSWMISSRDAALMTFEKPSQPRRRTDDPTDCHKMFSQVFDNTWDTNFNANAFGVMEFSFDIATGVSLDACDETALALATEPVVIVRTGFPE